MSKIEERAERAWQDYEYRANGNLYSTCFKDGYKQGVAEVLSHQWRSVEEDGLPEPKDYEHHLTPTAGDDKPTLYVMEEFLLYVEYKDGSGHDFCEANFTILPDGSFAWLFCDDYIVSQIGNFNVTHWMPIPPLPKARKDNNKTPASQLKGNG